MIKITRLLAVIVALLCVAFAQPSFAAVAQAETGGASSASSAEFVRSTLVRAQLSLPSDKAAASAALASAEGEYEGKLGPVLASASADAAARVGDGFSRAKQAVQQGDAPLFAQARAQIWTAILQGGFAVAEQSVAAGDLDQAGAWLQVREFRQATRFARPNADATKALLDLRSGAITTESALVELRADLLDSYQARLGDALTALTRDASQNFAMRLAEQGALAQGYFEILAPSYREQRGEAATAEAATAFGRLREATLTGQGLEQARAAVDDALHGFRAAPLSEADKVRRAGQLVRYLGLVPIEYARGVNGEQVTSDLEIQEAKTFRDGAEAAFADLRSDLEAIDSAATARIAVILQQLGDDIAAASVRTKVARAETVQSSVDEASKLLTATMPAEWQKHDSAADFDVIGSMLDQMESAASAGDYTKAESARLEAYAMLEAGPEARIVAFAPELKTQIEDLFWNGQGENKGLAYLLREKAPLKEVRATRAALDEHLAAASTIVNGNNAPFAVGTNAAIIVFREGLEAVLILASLMASLKFGETRKLRRPLWAGAVLALAASALVWVLASSLISTLARFGETLEAVVSLIAIAVLLLITNWFFHKVYWTGWISNFHSKKKRLIGGQTGQIVGLVALGFTSIFREGFEVVLFLQALVIESGVLTVLAGVAAGLAGTLLIGVLVFALQAKLPHKKMLVATGVMIGGVLLVMVGHTVHVMQVVGWLPIHLVPGLKLPFWTGTWLGMYATWEGLLLQFAAGAFVIGSYFLAERQKGKGHSSQRVAKEAREINDTVPTNA